MVKRISVLPILIAAAAAGQDLMEIDRQIGIAQQLRMEAQYGASGFISAGEDFERVGRVFMRMLQAPRFTDGAPPMVYRAYYVDSPVVNAFAAGGGFFYITSGLMKSIRSNDGVLAFVMAHEMIHNRNQHAARKYLREVSIEHEYRSLYAINGELAADLYATAARIAEKKIERDEEHEADQMGVLIAAEAGYHPDFAIYAERLLRAETGDRSKFAAFFESHPRWATREERTERNYDDAVAVFERRWPDVESSAGGRPPVIAIASPLKVERNHRDVALRSGVRVHNLRNGSPAELTLTISGEHGEEPVVILRKAYIADQTQEEAIRADVPSNVLRRKGEEFALLRIISGREELYASKALKVK